MYTYAYIHTYTGIYICTYIFIPVLHNIWKMQNATKRNPKVQFLSLKTHTNFSLIKALGFTFLVCFRSGTQGNKAWNH